MHGHARVMGEQVLQCGGFLRLQFAGGQPVLVAHRLRDQQRRAGISHQRADGVVRLHRAQVGLDQCRQVGRIE